MGDSVKLSLEIKTLIIALKLPLVLKIAHLSFDVESILLKILLASCLLLGLFENFWSLLPM